MSSPIFIGYPTVEELLAAVFPNRTAYALNFTHQHLKSGSPTLHTQAVIVQFVEAGLVHYCRIRVGDYGTLDGVPFGASATASEVQKQGETALSLIRDFLTEQGCTLKPGLVAMPKDLIWLEGDADFLGYNRETRQFYRK